MWESAAANEQMCSAAEETLTCERSFSRASIKATARKHTESFCCVFNNTEKHLPLQGVLTGGLSQFGV